MEKNNNIASKGLEVPAEVDHDEVGGQEEGLEVIGVGLPRTGTMSTATALSTLLNTKPENIFHGMQITRLSEDQLEFWPRAYRGETTDLEWRLFFRNHKAALDLPAILFYKDLMRVFPNAKIILTLRDPLLWYKSWHNSIAISLDIVTKAPYKWFVKHDPKVNPG